MTKKDEQEIMEVDFLKEPMSIAKVFVESGLFTDVKSQAQAVVKILAGREVGLTPFQSMKDIYIVNGKLAMQANAMASLVKTNPKYDYKVEIITNEECKISFWEIKGDKKEEIGISTFTVKDAAKAGVINKDPWKAYPRNLLFARALSNGVRFYCPDTCCGWHIVDEMEGVYEVNKKETITINAEGDVQRTETESV